MPTGATYRPAVRITELGDAFYDVVEAAEFPEHRLRHRNERAAKTVGLDSLTDAEWIEHFGRFRPLPDNLAAPLALRYHGHQFRNYNPDLGDGRGFLFGQLLECGSDRILDLGTKGTGRTPWSRGGDGRLTLKGGVREVLATEMLEALGVDTSKSFSLIETGEALERHDEPSPTRSAALVRLSHSHVRFGSFQRHASARDAQSIGQLVDYSIRHYRPQLQAETLAERAAALLRWTCERTADLAASWHVAGFVHGVLNTDNMNITGESFDYGPYRFLPTYDPNFVAAYFDQTGLYAFGRQPDSLAWNLQRLAETFLLICEREPLIEALKEFEPAFRNALQRRLVARLGLVSAGDGVDERRVDATYTFLHQSGVGHEAFFFDWFGGIERRESALHGPRGHLYTGAAFDSFFETLATEDAAPHASPATEPGARARYFERGEPCTLLIDEIESIWSAIAETDDWRPFHAKLDAIAEMRRALQDPAPESG